MRKSDYFSRKRTRNLFVNTLRKVLTIPEKLQVSQWAEKYRMLDESSNFKGRWSNDITPYLVGVMDAFNDPYIQEINFCKSTQVGGTEAMLNILGWIIMDDPAPTLLVYPTDDLAKEISNDRIVPSLTKTPEINDRYLKNTSKERALRFRGMRLYLSGAGGAKPAQKLASKAVKYLFFDEIDKLDGASKKEASPYSLARERTRTFSYTRKIYTCSTPTLRTNYVWMLHEQADEQRNYFVPCPHCGEFIIFRWKQIIFDDGEGKTNDERAKSAVYVCQECGCEITDRDKIKMLRAGEWRAVQKNCIGKPRKVSFWINCLYSRFLTWSEIVTEFLKSKDDPDQLQNFVNSWLAEPWEDTKLKTSSDLVLERQTEVPELTVPEWAVMLTGGVDVQENCLYWTIRAWGNHMTSQNIAHGQAVSFTEIERIMNLEYAKESGGTLLVCLCLVDSGNDTDSVYDFCANNADWSLPCKGASNNMQSHYRLSTVNRATSAAHGMNLVLVDGGRYKDMIAARMRRHNGEGSWMVYNGCDVEYAEQVTAEHKVNVKTAGGQTKPMWVPKTSHAANHYLDTEVYAMAAADIMGIRTAHLQEVITEPEPKEPDVNPEADSEWISAKEEWI